MATNIPFVKAGLVCFLSQKPLLAVVSTNY
jgi:hypothetical protein